MATVIDNLKKLWKRTPVILKCVVVVMLAIGLLLGSIWRWPLPPMEPPVKPQNPPTEPTEATSASFQVSASIDDGVWAVGTGWSMTGTYLMIYSHPTADSRRHGAVRFGAVNVPSASTINSANLSLYVYSTSKDYPNLDIYCHDVDDAPVLGSGEGLLDRVKTGNSTEWVEDINVVGWANITVTSAFQEIIDRSEWSSGNNVSFFLIAKTATYRTFYPRAWDYSDHTLAPKLYVEYTEPTVAPEWNYMETSDNKDCGESSDFNVNWTANSGTMHYYEVCHNNSGPWQNTTYAFSGSTWSNHTISALNATGGCLLAREIKANNTEGGENSTGVQYLWIWRQVPSVAEADLGPATWGSRGDIYYNGSREAIYVVYLNGSTATGTYQVKAYDVNNYNWTSAYDIASSIDKDGHHTPAITVLGDGRLAILYGYYSDINCTISTYSADEENDLETLISNWEEAKATPITFQGCYPATVRWDDRLLVFARQGTSAIGDWVYIKWDNFTSDSLWCTENDSVRTGWGTTGAQPYLSDSETNNIYTGTANAEMGDFYFANVSSTQEGYIDQLWQVNLTLRFTGPADLFDVYVWNGTWNNVSRNPYHASFDDWIIDISDYIDTIEEINNTKIYFKHTTGVGTATIEKARLNYLARMWSASQTLINFPDTSLYAMPIKAGDNVIVTFHHYNSSKPVTSRYENIYAIYSDDKGDSWKYVNGTSVSLPITAPSDTQVDLLKASTTFAVIDENGKLVVPINRRPEEEQIQYAQLAQYSAGLGQVGTWDVQNVTTSTIDADDFEPIQGLFMDMIYNRPAFWTTEDTNGYVIKLVRYGADTHKFRVVYTDEDYSNVTLGGLRLIQDSPIGYDIVSSETYLGVLSYLDIGQQQNVTSKDYLYGVNFTATATNNLLVANIWQNPFGVGATLNMALYNSTFHLVSYTNTPSAHPVEKWTYWCSFQNHVMAANIVEGEHYWLCFRVSDDDTGGIQYKYDAGSTNQTFVYPLNWTDGYPSTISPTEYYDRVITMKACPIQQIARGMGLNYPMSFSNTGTNVTEGVTNEPAEWHTYVIDANGLSHAEYYWNVTGSLEKNETQALSGTEAWVNFSKVIPQINGKYVIEAIIGVNDTSNNWQNSTTIYLNVSAYTVLVVGWNNVSAWDIDIGKTLGQVNGSLVADAVNWTYLVVEYPNGSQYGFVFGQGVDENPYYDVEVVANSFLYVWCTDAEAFWYHSYEG